MDMSHSIHSADWREGVFCMGSTRYGFPFLDTFPLKSAKIVSASGGFVTYELNYRAGIEKTPKQSTPDRVLGGQWDPVQGVS